MLHTLSLDGTWDLVWNDTQRGTREPDSVRPGLDPSRCLSAQVPGDVHLDLERAGLLADVNQGLNVLAARWVEETWWCYRRHFQAPELPAGARVWLVFSGIDHDAVIYFNGVEIGRHSGSFTPCRLDVTGKLQPGENLLAVTVESGLYGVGDKPGTGFGDPGSLLHKRAWLRKPQSHFGGDWAPRLLNVGLAGSVYLEWTAAPVRPDRLVSLVTVSDDLSTGTVTARWFVEGLAESTAVEIEAEVVEAAATTRQAMTVGKGLGGYACTLTVAKPRLWWPVGHGPQDRYTLRVRLLLEGAVIAERTVRIGFRRARFDQSPHPDGGRFFVLEINNRRIFCKGGNVVPADVITARIDRSRYVELLDRALEANFNFLRVWGGGLYEHDDFYDLCDERGILVWQEFIFMCSHYPGHDEGFYDTVKREAIHQIRRLAGHPALIAWCGNNENEMWYWDQLMPDHGLFHNLLPRLLTIEDGTRYYQPSSPFSPDGLPPNDDSAGDQHPWSVGFHDTDFRKYRQMICRFSDESGILGPNALPTVLECLPEGQRRVGSFAWMQHDNGVDCWPPAGAPDRMLTQWTGKDSHALGIPEAVYWMGLIQGEGLTALIDNFRRRMFSSAAAVFWMYNDCWPCTRSWTIVDYHRRRTPGFHPVRRAFATLRLVLTEVEGEIQVWGVCLDLDGEQPLADNFFDLWPGIPYSIPWSGSASPKILFTGNLS